MSKNISIIIPIYNEEELLKDAVIGLLDQLADDFKGFELLLTENGSSDQTREIMKELEGIDPRVKCLTDPNVADYGQALIDGINACKFDEICILEIAYLDLKFLRSGLELLSDFDLIIGSKKISPGIDQRPWKRKFFSNAYNLILKLFFGLTLSETHGLKVLRKSSLLEIANICITRHAVYPSEFVLRACRDPHIKATEIPLTLPLIELRNTRITASKRLRKTLNDLRRLHKALYKKTI